LAILMLAIAAGCSPASPTPSGTSASTHVELNSSAAAARTGVASVHTCTPPYAPTLTVFCADPAAMQPARVVRIVDGDTIHVDLSGKEEIIRFYGINTTERGQACFDEGTERTRQLVGQEVRLLPDARERDRYGRLLRYVYTPDGLSIDAEMVDEGFAHAWRSDGALRFAIIALEDGAMARHAGCLWR
jgi:micrococcal nuclease